MISVESASIMEYLLEPIRLDILNRLLNFVNIMVNTMSAKQYRDTAYCSISTSRLFSLSKKQNDKESSSAKSKFKS